MHEEIELVDSVLSGITESCGVYCPEGVDGKSMGESIADLESIVRAVA